MCKKKSTFELGKTIDEKKAAQCVFWKQVVVQGKT